VEIIINIKLAKLGVLEGLEVIDTARKANVLMTKFNKFEKNRLSDLLFWNIRFRQFQNRNKISATLENLKIQDILKYGKG
jgi:hypothetical protein